MTRSFETKNVIIWLGDNKSLYQHLRGYAQSAQSPTYLGLIESLGYLDSRTPDDVDWVSDKLDYEDLDNFVKEIGIDA